MIFGLGKREDIWEIKRDVGNLRSDVDNLRSALDRLLALCSLERLDGGRLTSFYRQSRHGDDIATLRDLDDNIRDLKDDKLKLDALMEHLKLEFYDTPKVEAIPSSIAVRKKKSK